MAAEHKFWKIVYRRPNSEETVSVMAAARTRAEAFEMAQENNVRDKATGFFWEIVSVEEAECN